MVEIAPGQGRWSRYLLDLCDQFTGFDIAPNTVAFCERWLADVGRAQRRFAVNNGADFPGVADGSVDLVFSFDSLVHAEQDVMDGYLDEIARVLRPDGRAFLHHSNLGLFAGSPGDNVHCRGETVSAESVRRAAHARRLSVVVQEMIAWQGDRCIDCLTTLRRSCAAAPPPRVFYNEGFWRDAARLKATIAPYHAAP